MSLSPSPRLLKICGLTNTVDALAAAAVGADWLGLILVPNTPRQVSLPGALEMVHSVRTQYPHIQWVGVFQNAPLEEIERYCNSLGLDRVQLHGNERPEFCAQISVPVIKTLLLTAEMTVSELRRQATAYLQISSVQTLLLDLPKGSAFSTVLDRAHSAPVHSDSGPEKFRAFLSDYPCWLAGGLTPANLPQTLQTFQPVGVDVASGVEKKPGQKDVDQMRQFCQIVKQFKIQPNQGDNALCNP